MKRFILMLLSLFVSMSLAACSNTDTSTSTALTGTEAAVSTAPTESNTEPTVPVTTTDATEPNPVDLWIGNTIERHVLQHWNRVFYNCNSLDKLTPSECNSYLFSAWLIEKIYN